MVDYVVRTAVGYGVDGEPRAAHWTTRCSPPRAGGRERERRGTRTRRGGGAAGGGGGGGARQRGGRRTLADGAASPLGAQRRRLTDPTTRQRIRGFREELAIAGGRRGALAVSAARMPPAEHPRGAAAPPSAKLSTVLCLSARLSIVLRFLPAKLSTVLRGAVPRSGKGGAGMSRGRSVAAMEEEVDPAHAARLRESSRTPTASRRRGSRGESRARGEGGNGRRRRAASSGGTGGEECWSQVFPGEERREAGAGCAARGIPAVRLGAQDPQDPQDPGAIAAGGQARL